MKTREKYRLKREKILKDIKKGASYKEIGLKYSITKQRIYQIAKMNNVSRWDESRNKAKETYKNVVKELKNNIPAKEIYKKYGRRSATIYKEINNETPYEKQLRIRNNDLVSKFNKGFIAKELINLDSNELNNVNSIYKINTKKGIKRYPQIGNRSAGGSFEKKSIINLIVKLRNKGISFVKITDKLNNLGYKTITGRKFTTPNVIVKYHKYNNKK